MTPNGGLIIIQCRVEKVSVEKVQQKGVEQRFSGNKMIESVENLRNLSLGFFRCK